MCLGLFCHISRPLLLLTHTLYTPYAHLIHTMCAPQRPSLPNGLANHMARPLFPYQYASFAILVGLFCRLRIPSAHHVHTAASFTATRPRASHGPGCRVCAPLQALHLRRAAGRRQPAQQIFEMSTITAALLLLLLVLYTCTHAHMHTCTHAHTHIYVLNTYICAHIHIIEATGNTSKTSTAWTAAACSGCLPTKAALASSRCAA